MEEPEMEEVGAKGFATREFGIPRLSDLFSNTEIDKINCP
jgi:hypothetical protein